MKNAVLILFRSSKKFSTLIIYSRSRIDKISPAIDASHRELSTKFRALVRQHRKMVKQFSEGDEFVPFLDRKVNFLMISRLYLIFLR